MLNRAIQILIVLIGISILLVGVKWKFQESLELNECDMTYMWPNLYRINNLQSEYIHKYSLHLYREGSYYKSDSHFVKSKKE